MIKQPNDLSSRLKSLKLVSFDVDGVLTDGSISFDEEGNVSRTFNVKDGLGLQRLQDAGIVVAIISAGTTASITERFQRLGIKHVHIGVKDKLGRLTEIAEVLGIPLAEAAHMGDDLNDIKLIKALGLGIAPADAVEAVLEAADWIVTKVGGRGAVREVSDAILAAQQVASEASHLET